METTTIMKRVVERDQKEGISSEVPSSCSALPGPVPKSDNGTVENTGVSTPVIEHAGIVTRSMSKQRTPSFDNTTMASPPKKKETTLPLVPTHPIEGVETLVEDSQINTMASDHTHPQDPQNHPGRLGTEMRPKHTGQDGAPAVIELEQGGPDVDVPIMPNVVRDGDRKPPHLDNQLSAMDQEIKLLFGDHSVGTTFISSELLIHDVVTQQADANFVRRFSNVYT
jgi:hypothetical protein